MKVSHEEGVRRVFSSGAQYVIGIDEVGLGAWAGPLVVSGVVLKKGWGHEDIKDSKKFGSTKTETAHERRKKVLNTVIRPNEVWAYTITRDSWTIDANGVRNELLVSMHAVARTCWSHYNDSIVVIDGNVCPDLAGHVPSDRLIVMPKADTMIPAVAAASITAKVTRDDAMIELSEEYPGYGFEKHVGYGTKEHKEALIKLGACVAHRQSYSPVKQLGGGSGD